MNGASPSPHGPPKGTLTDADRAEIARRGLTEDEVRRQLDLCHEPPAALQLVRPATLGDGIVRLEEERHAELLELHAEAAAAGRFTKMVPASGAATRMFKALLAVRGGNATDEDRAFAEECFNRRHQLPFRNQLAEVATLGDFLDDVLGRLALGDVPKALLPFHHYASGARTPFEEHLVEAAEQIRDNGNVCRLHFTVTEAHEGAFRVHLADVAERLGERLGARYEVGFSFQDPATDTVAADPDGGAFRDDAGHLVFRPGGHGSLIHNLNRLDADLVYLKNIDNMLPDGRRPLVVLWKKLLGGFLCHLERRLADLRDRSGNAWLDEARAFLREDFAVPGDHLPADEDVMRELLFGRPLRVCGMVPATGETGGGPFWVRDTAGNESRQVVETSQVDRGRADQEAVLRRATHFNPVDVVCRLRDAEGNAYDLKRFVDPNAVFVARKSHEGRPILALEHPGLWNGAMSGWLTAFVEVPAATFAPVKTVLDLLRPEHQPGS